MTRNVAEYSSAIEDFHRARRKSALEQILARLTGRSTDLLSYEEVRKRLKIQARKPPELREIPLDSIVGSVDRYTDFTRSFLPKQESDADRWAGVKVAVTDLKGLPPINVYQIGDAYFVEDGNHRVSVARQLGQSHIQAYVTEMKTKVPITTEDDVDDLIIKAEYVDFLESTQLDQTRPEADLRLTAPGGFETLQDHITVHRHFMGLEQQREIPYEEAAAHWYDEVYLPVVQVIREQGIMRDFPGRTETDLYLWISDHRALCQEILEMEIDTHEAITDLAAFHSSRPQRVVARLSDKIMDALIPDEFLSEPTIGVVHKDFRTPRERLFGDILVPISGDEVSFGGLVQAIVIAKREDSRLYGLHIVPSQAEKESESARAIKADFERRCAEAGVRGNLVLVVGEVSHTICDRARWTDLVALNISYPPPPQILGRLSSGVTTVIRRCPRPILAVPRTTTSLSRALLAFDGSPKSEEALYIACYLAENWEIPLVVVSVNERGQSAQEVNQRAQNYLQERGVEADMVLADGPVVDAILRTAEERQSEVLVMGGYGRSRVPEIVLGSVVDEVLRTGCIPVLISR